MSSNHEMRKDTMTLEKISELTVLMRNVYPKIDFLQDLVKIFKSIPDFIYS